MTTSKRTVPSRPPGVRTPTPGIDLKESALPDHHRHARGLLSLQREAGNHAVAQMLRTGGSANRNEQVLPGLRVAAASAARSTLHVQRGDPLSGGDASTSELTRGAALEARVKKAATTSSATGTALSTGLTTAVTHVDQVLTQLNGVATTYETAYESYQAVIEEAKAREAAIDAAAALVIGVLISTGVGVGLGALAPLAATASRSVIVFAEARNAAIAAVLAAGSSDVLPSKGRPSTTAASFADKHPAMMKVKAYQQAADLYRTLALMGARFGSIADIQHAAAQLQADCRELALSGKHRTSTEAAISVRVASLEDDAKRVAGLKATFTDLFTKIDDAKIDASLANQDASATRMERDIWVFWMASLTDDQAEILDSDPIESRLGSLNLMAKRGMENAPQLAWQSDLDWGVGTWHSDDDSREGARKARGGVAKLQMVGQQGRFRLGGLTGGEFVDANGDVFAAAPNSNERSKWDLDGKTVVVLSVSLSTSLVRVDLPSAAQEDRRGTYLARTLKGKTVTLKDIREKHNSTGRTEYYATATSPEHPGRDFPARAHLLSSGIPVEGGTGVVLHADGQVLVIESPERPLWPNL